MSGGHHGIGGNEPEVDLVQMAKEHLYKNVMESGREAAEEILKRVKKGTCGKPGVKGHITKRWEPAIEEAVQMWKDKQTKGDDPNMYYLFPTVQLGPLQVPSGLLEEWGISTRKNDSGGRVTQIACDTSGDGDIEKPDCHDDKQESPHESEEAGMSPPPSPILLPRGGGSPSQSSVRPRKQTCAKPSMPLSKRREMLNKNLER